MTTKTAIYEMLKLKIEANKEKVYNTLHNGKFTQTVYMEGVQEGLSLAKAIILNIDKSYFERIEKNFKAYRRS